jgi:hypothetical protein
VAVSFFHTGKSDRERLRGVEEMGDTVWKTLQW